MFGAGRRAGLVPDEVSLEHVGFGLVLGDDGKKIKTRAGEAVKLRELLMEAISRARVDLVQRLTERGELGRSHWSEEQIDAVAKVLGIGSVKYADLCMHREGTYKFSYDKMLSMSGNTAPYMIYCYVRVRGIHRKVMAITDDSERISDWDSATPPSLPHAADVALGVQLLRFSEVLEVVAEKAYPHKVEKVFIACACYSRSYPYGEC